jgi:hypothetical protein
MCRTGLIFLAALAVAGCSRKVAIDNPIRITAEEYDRVFESSVDVLRNHLFTVSRQDRRFGVITTRPRPASSALQFWTQDNTTGYQTLDNTLNHQRRTVRITLKPRPPVTVEPGPIEPNQPAGEYDLQVQVLVERRQHPDRELNTAAASSVAHYGRSAGARSLLTEAGDETSYWRSVGRDQLLEQRLVNRILARASVVAPRHETEPPDAPDDDMPAVQ